MNGEVHFMLKFFNFSLRFSSPLFDIPTAGCCIEIDLLAGYCLEIDRHPSWIWECSALRADRCPDGWPRFWSPPLCILSVHWCAQRNQIWAVHFRHWMAHSALHPPRFHYDDRRTRTWIVLIRTALPWFTIIPGRLRFRWKCTSSVLLNVQSLNE